MTPDAADVALNNRGVALMGYFDYEGARSAFAQLIDKRADWHDARINLGVALMNRQQSGDEQRALDQLAIVVAAEPDNLRANYVSGLLRLYLGDVAEAARHFETVLANDADDAYAHYYYGQSQQQSGDAEAALASYKRALQLDPYLRSAYYSAAQVLQRLDRRDEAADLLGSFERFANNPRARLAEFKYTRMGPKSLAITSDDNGADRPALVPPVGPLFEPPLTIADVPDLPASSNLTTVDIDHDGTQELFIASASADSSKLLRTDSNGGLQDVQSQPWSEVGQINAVAWGDVDNNGLVDVYLCRSESDELWLQIAAGEWEQFDPFAGVDIEIDDSDCADAALVDADHDGDLDILLANRNAPNQLLNNNRDGTFRSLADSIGNAATVRHTRRVVTADVDADRDVDLLFVNDSPPHDLLINDRLWRYAAATGLDDFVNSDLRAVAIMDLDTDGHTELVGLTGSDEIVAWFSGQDGAWQRNSIYRPDLPPNADVDLAPVDINGDGRRELAILGTGLFEIIAIGDDMRATQLATDRFDGGVPLPVLRNTARGTSLIALSESSSGATLLEWAPGAGRFPFAAIALSGTHDEADTMRSNASGIGTLLGLRNGSHWTLTDTYKSASLRGQSLQPLSVGLRGRQSADFVSLHWSDGVFQTELDLEAGVVHQIAETERQLSSCPVLFAWNGDRFAFITDLLGVGGLGGFVEPGVTGTPRPWERLALPPETVKPLHGRLTFKLTEPMQENAYLDSAWLETYDLPVGWKIAVDERMGTGSPQVTGDVLFYRKSIAPSEAFDSTGRDVLERISRRDSRAMDPGKIDRRFIGLLEQEESLTLEFGQPIDSGHPDSHVPVLLADAWVEYPYSQTVFSAWQAGLEYRSATLEARDAEGSWRTIYQDFGYPAGMPREMSLPLANLPQGSTALRLSWNRELYWDRIRIVYAEPPPAEMQHARSGVELARVAKTGFALRTTHTQRRPAYDYQQRTPFWDTEYATGFYTKLGDATELLSQTDNALAIIGPGEEIHLEFSAGEASLPGLQRWHVLEARGWAKDKDLYTHEGETVGPLPRAGNTASEDEHAALHQRYNIRFQAGR